MTTSPPEATDAPMTLPRLFHGTTVARLQFILEKGILPSSQIGNRHYAHMRPTTDFVYLCSYRAFKYSDYASVNDQLKFDPIGLVWPASVVLVEIDTSELDLANLRPDEDLYTRLVGELPKCPDGSQIGIDWAEENPELWRTSLDVYGSVAHKGAIPVACIRKVGLLFLRPTCLVSSVIRKFNTFKDPAHWQELKFKHEAITRAIMGEGIAPEEILSEEEIANKGTDRDTLSAWLESATVTTYERDDQGKWTPRLFGDHSPM